MNKEKILNFIIEFISYIIVLVVVLLIFQKLGLIETPILNTAIGITIGWLIWKLIMAIKK